MTLDLKPPKLNCEKAMLAHAISSGDKSQIILQL